MRNGHFSFSPVVVRYLRSFLLFLLLSPGISAVRSSAQQASSVQAASAEVSGQVIDQEGSPILGASVMLDGAIAAGRRQTATDADGDFLFSGLPAGVFQLGVNAPGFDESTMPVIALAEGQILHLPAIPLRVAGTAASVQVQASAHDIAAEQVKSAEKQRLLGLVPNFYVTYFPQPAPLSAGQKMGLAWRTVIDPAAFVGSALVAAQEHNSKYFKDYGKGAAGFGRRFGAAYGDDFFGVMLGSGVLPAVLHQDPRYYYKGTGSKTSRVFYALSWSFRCKGDNGQWQPNYSFLLGDLAATGIADLYYPKALRDNAGKTIEYSFIDIGFQGVGAILQEFFFKKVTTHTKDDGKLP